MKNKEIKSFDIADLKNKLILEQESLNKLKFAHSLSPIDNPMRIRDARRVIARLHTEIRNKENFK